MVGKTLAFMMVAAVGALALEVVFGVHLGIADWMHQAFDPGDMNFLRM